VGVQDATRDQLQLEALAVDDEGVSGVVTTLVTNDKVLITGKEIREFALPFVTPLGSDDDGGWHG
jgi:hypothetical protein